MSVRKFRIPTHIRNFGIWYVAGVGTVATWLSMPLYFDVPTGISGTPVTLFSTEWIAVGGLAATVYGWLFSHGLSRRLARMQASIAALSAFNADKHWNEEFSYAFRVIRANCIITNDRRHPEESNIPRKSFESNEYIDDSSKLGNQTITTNDAPIKPSATISPQFLGSEMKDYLEGYKQRLLTGSVLESGHKELPAPGRNIQSVGYVLGQFEFLSAGIVNRTFNEQVIKGVHRTSFIRLFSAASEMIMAMRKDPYLGSLRYMANFELIAQRWANEEFIELKRREKNEKKRQIKNMRRIEKDKNRKLREYVSDSA